MLFAIDNTSMTGFETMQVPNHAQHKSWQVVYQGSKSYQEGTCDEITWKFESSPKSNHETQTERFMQSCKVKQNKDHAITKHQSCNHAKLNKTKIMRSQNTNHATMQIKTKQTSCDHKTPIMQACKVKQTKFMQSQGTNHASMQFKNWRTKSTNNWNKSNKYHLDF